MSDTTDAVSSPAQIRELPAPVAQFLTETGATGTPAPIALDQLLKGGEWDGVKADLRANGFAQYRENDGTDRVLVADFDASGNVMAMAAAIPRSSGKALDFLHNVADFKDALNANVQSRKDAVTLFAKVARADGVSNNAINKLAALICPDGKFKVRSVKGQRGKAGDKAATEIETLLNWWAENVNSRSDTSVISGDRGMKSFITQGTRLQLIEGDHIARQIWGKAQQVPPLSKAYSLPMNLQTFSASNVEIPVGLEGTNLELIYWRPPANLVNTITSAPDPNVRKALQKFIPAKVLAVLKRDGRYLLEPSLMIHIKHRATQTDTFGQSLIEPTIADIRYKRALDALELTVISSVMARMVIIKVGSDNEKSAYHTATVTAGRLSLLQRMMRTVGPSATVLWGGPDLSVVEVSAHDALLDIVPRMAMAERRHLMSLGMPAALMVGEGSDGKAAGFASFFAVAAQLAEIQDQYAQMLRSLAEAIAVENGFEDIDVVWEWSNNILEDKQAASELLLKLFDRGLISTQTIMEENNFDYGAEIIRQTNDVTAGYKDEVFGLPKQANVQGDVAANPSSTSVPSGPGAPAGPPKPNAPNPNGSAGGGGANPGAGRPTKKVSGKPDARTGKEKVTTVENK